MPSGQQNAYLTFRNINVPAQEDGVTIIYNKAYIRVTAEVTVDEFAINDCTCLVDAHCNNDATGFIPNTNEDNRTATKVPWAVNEWTAETTYDTPDLACILQEIEAQGWDRSEVTFYINGDTNFDATSGGDGMMRVAYDYLDSTGLPTNKEAELFLWYSAEYTETPEGGLLFGGEADVSVAKYFYPDGTGLLFDGTVPPSVEIEIDGSGLLFDGTTDALVQVKLTGEGLLFDGTSVPTVELTVSGGIVFGDAAFENGYSQRSLITVPAGEVSEDLEKFYLGVTAQFNPALVKTGTDFRVETLDGTRLYHELRGYDSTSGRVWLTFKADLDASSDNNWYLYFGKET